MAYKFNPFTGKLDDAGTPGSGGGTVDSVVAGTNIDVDATDPANPIVSVESLTVSDITDLTASATELNYVDGVTSAIQTQLDGKVNDTGAESIAGVKTFGDGILTDTIGEETAAAGVTIDGVLIKDNGITATGDIEGELILGTGLIIDGAAVSQANTTSTSPQLSVTQAGTGDAAMLFALSSTRSYAVGIDNSDSDSFVISTAASTSPVLGTGNLLKVTSGGNVSTTGSLTVGTAGTSAGSAATIDGAQTLTNKTLTSPVINTPTGIVKGDVGLGNVDNTSDATKDAAATTLTNKTLTTPTIAQINNSSAPGVKLQVRTQTDDSNSISSATTAGVFVQYGWGQMIGNSTAIMSESVTFPTAFTTVLGVLCAPQASTGNDSVAASSITDFEVSTGADGVMASSRSVSMSGFTVDLSREGASTFASNRYYGYSWIAWGV